jgi:pimeloyl-ACP methyl ester carboxylesterase
VWITDCVVEDTDLGMLHPGLECTGLEVPLDWDAPDGERITIAAERVRTTATRRGQVWLLEGGPGGSGLGFFDEAPIIEPLLAAGYDVVVPNHRGIFAPALRCNSPSASVECRAELTQAWGDGLRHFNTVQAAKDVRELIARMDVDEPDGETIVYGVSYGTFWASHVLQVSGELLDGVVLDSVLPYGVDVSEQQVLVQARAVDLLQRCVDDPVCGAKVGFASGEAFAQAIVAAIDDGDCGGYDNGTWADSSYRAFFGGMLNTKGERDYIPLLGALLTRCTNETSDIADTAISQILGGQSPLQPGRDRFGIPGDLIYSEETWAVVVATMLVGDGVDTASAVEAAQQHLADNGILEEVDLANQFFGDLPNPQWSQEPPPAVPVLVLAGRYDTQTPLPWAERERDRTGATLELFEDTQHAIAYPGTGGKFPDGTPCATTIIGEFVDDPGATPDDSCIAELRGIDVNLAADFLQTTNMNAFGVADPWTLLP